MKSVLINKNLCEPFPLNPFSFLYFPSCDRHKLLWTDPTRLGGSLFLTKHVLKFFPDPFDFLTFQRGQKKETDVVDCVIKGCVDRFAPYRLHLCFRKRIAFLLNG